jgi:hypothetical protein
MVDWRKLIFLAVGVGLVILQSFFLALGLTVIWAVVVSWMVDDPWWLLFVIGLVTDVFYLTPLGKTSLILLGLGLAVKYLKSIFGFSESYKMKVSRF